jgi:dynein heavy chain
MLPTPAKSHYTFNLRDLSKVFQGILSLREQQCADTVTYSRLWAHECMRVFQDRLIDREDKVHSRDGVEQLYLTCWAVTLA